tara:strand:+ start:138 stop:446 length:309 start_codon:yes stop_codon:yes gene_type:complete
MEPETYETTAGSVSNFMQWAERRLSEEVDKNNKIEEALSKSTPDADKTLSPNARILAIKQIHKYRNEGKTVVEACALLNIHPNTYNNWRRFFKISVFKKYDI